MTGSRGSGSEGAPGAAAAAGAAGAGAGAAGGAGVRAASGAVGGAGGAGGAGVPGRGGPCGARAVVEWLAAVAPDPGACRWEWERDPRGVALLPAGRRWDVLIIPARLGYPTLDVLQRLVARPGPVLCDFGDERMGFFVPPGTAARWLGTGVRGAGRGTWIVVPYPGRTTGAARWLVLPDGVGTLTDPALLELAMHEAAARLAAGGDDGRS